MPDHLNRAGGLPPAYTSAGTSSFTDFLGMVAPDQLPGRRPLPPGAADLGPHATTIVAVTFDLGVVMAGDRRATMGNLIAQRDIVKVFAADDYSMVAAAGVAGIGMEMVRLFQVEVEHYEKLEGVALTLDGKANRLASMIRSNLGAAMQGLGALPLFAGYDMDAADPAKAGRIFSYDMVGGCYEEYGGFHSVGSGSVFARGSLKARWRPGQTEGETLRDIVEALYDASDEDTATGGPDLTRSLFPVVLVATAAGVRRLSDGECGELTRAAVAARTTGDGA